MLSCIVGSWAGSVKGEAFPGCRRRRPTNAVGWGDVGRLGTSEDGQRERGYEPRLTEATGPTPSCQEWTLSGSHGGPPPPTRASCLLCSPPSMYIAAATHPAPPQLALCLSTSSIHPSPLLTASSLDGLDTPPPLLDAAYYHRLDVVSPLTAVTSARNQPPSPPHLSIADDQSRCNSSTLATCQQFGSSTRPLHFSACNDPRRRSKPAPGHADDWRRRRLGAMHAAPLRTGKSWWQHPLGTNHAARYSRPHGGRRSAVPNSQQPLTPTPGTRHPPLASIRICDPGTPHAGRVGPRTPHAQPGRHCQSRQLDCGRG